ncbi:phospholipase D family protein [Oxalobacteraceae bacterium OM1]|nr:phospholipase D family protein [Oxalobacteraceae bacterium OM1]
MKRIAALTACIGWLFVAGAAHAEAGVLAARGTVEAAFAPGDDVEQLVCDVIAAARQQVLVQAYLLTSKKIASTLVSTRRRGVDVRILADADQDERTESSQLRALAAAGVPVWLETKYQNAHNKIVIVDAGRPDATVLTGSFNFTWTAQHRNAENVIVLRHHPALAARYADNWEKHREEAVPYKK